MCPSQCAWGACNEDQTLQTRPQHDIWVDEGRRNLGETCVWTNDQLEGCGRVHWRVAEGPQYLPLTGAVRMAGMRSGAADALPLCIHRQRHAKMQVAKCPEEASGSSANKSTRSPVRMARIRVLDGQFCSRQLHVEDRVTVPKNCDALSGISWLRHCMVLVLRARAVRGSSPLWPVTLFEERDPVDSLASCRMSEQMAGRGSCFSQAHATGSPSLINAVPPLFLHLSCTVLRHHAFPADGWLQRGQEARGVADSR